MAEIIQQQDSIRKKDRVCANCGHKEFYHHGFFADDCHWESLTFECKCDKFHE